jgi:hypothetical protein
MPTRRHRLSQAGRDRYLSDATQLRRAGLEIKIPEDLSVNDPVINIMLGRDLGSLVSQSYGRVHYAVWVRMVALRACMLVRWRITTKWDDQVEPNSYGGRSPLCKLGQLDYTETEVLNSRIEESLRFSHPGDMIEGVLLATGIRPIPKRHRQGMLMPFELTIADQFEDEISVEGLLSVSYTANPERSGLPCGTGLYGPAGCSRRMVAGEDLGDLQRLHSFPSGLDSIERTPQHNVRYAKAEAEV